MLNLLLLAAMVWVDHPSEGRFELKEDGKTALVYNYGQQLKPGVPEDRRRCCYIYPVFTPNGVSPLDDFAKDHYHHRGLFWAWPEVEVDGTVYDIWMMKGIQQRSISHRPGHFVNGWFIGDRQVVRETVDIQVAPKTRTIQVALRFEALGAPVILRGAHDTNKSYGGFSARFAPRTGTTIRTAEGPIAKNDDLTFHKWAELEGVYEGKKATLRITPTDAHQYQWCLREYGFVGASFPGKTDKVSSYTLRKGTPLTLTYKVQLTE